MECITLIQLDFKQFHYITIDLLFIDCRVDWGSSSKAPNSFLIIVVLNWPQFLYIFQHLWQVHITLALDAACLGFHSQTGWKWVLWLCFTGRDPICLSQAATWSHYDRTSYQLSRAEELGLWWHQYPPLTANLLAQNLQQVDEWWRSMQSCWELLRQSELRTKRRVYLSGYLSNVTKFQSGLIWKLILNCQLMWRELQGSISWDTQTTNCL